MPGPVVSPERRGFTVLLIEDNATDAGMVRRMLAERTDADGFDVVHYEDLDQAAKSLDDPEFDAVMIGLAAADEADLEVVAEMRRHGSPPPIFVLSETDDERFAVQAIRAGAQDCLPKGHLAPAALARSLRCGIERARLARARSEPTARSDGRDELETWAAMCSPAPLRVARKSFGQSSLRDADAAFFADLVVRYQDILDRSLEERAMKTNKGVVEDLRGLADQLGAFGASPRDVIELHTAAIATKLKRQPLQKAKAYVLEARLLLLKLMGDLASFYRNLSWGKAAALGGRLPVNKVRPTRGRGPGLARK
ncbi:MAG: response regulator [Rhodospirillales bacterium]